MAIIDTETTGLGQLDEPITIGIVLCEVDLPKGGLLQELDAYYGTREPTVPIGRQAFAVHGITLDSLRGTDFDHAKVRKMFARAEYIFAHNCAFDARMLTPIFPELSTKAWRCSARQIWWADFIPVADRKLDTICAHFGINRPEPHNALDDCRALLDALARRTGKTVRSRTFLGAALAKGDFIFGASKPAPSHTDDMRIEFVVSLPPPRSIHAEPMQPFVAMRQAEEAQVAPKAIPKNRDVIMIRSAFIWFGLLILACVLVALNK